MSLTMQEAEALKVYYRQRNWAIKDYWDKIDQLLPILANKGEIQFGPMHIKGGRAYLPNGSFLDYTTLRQVKAKDTDPEWKKNKPQWALWTSKGVTRIHKGIVTAHFTSSLAGLTMREALVPIAKHYKVALTCYDEIVCVVDEDEALDCKAWMDECLSTPPWWLPNLPVKVESHISALYDK